MSRAEEKARELASLITGCDHIVKLVTKHAYNVNALWYAYEEAQRAFAEWEHETQHKAAYKITTVAGELMAEILDMIYGIEGGK